FGPHPAGEKHAAAPDRLHGTQDVFDGLGLVDVAVHADRHEVGGQALAGVSRDHQDLRIRNRASDLARDIEPVEVGQHEIHDQEVGLFVQAKLQARFSEAKFAHDLQVFDLAEGQENQLAKHGFVFDENGTNFTHASDSRWVELSVIPKMISG